MPRDREDSKGSSGALPVATTAQHLGSVGLSLTSVRGQGPQLQSARKDSNLPSHAGLPCSAEPEGPLPLSPAGGRTGLPLSESHVPGTSLGRFSGFFTCPRGTIPSEEQKEKTGDWDRVAHAGCGHEGGSVALVPRWVCVPLPWGQRLSTEEVSFAMSHHGPALLRPDPWSPLTPTTQEAGMVSVLQMRKLRLQERK